MSTIPTESIDVPKLLTEAQVDFFVENGYLVVPNLISMEEVEELRQDTVRVARGVYPCESIPPASESLTDDDILRTILCIHQPHFISPVMAAYVRHPKICGILSQITAAHLPVWDGSV